MQKQAVMRLKSLRYQPNFLKDYARSEKLQYSACQQIKSHKFTRHLKPIEPKGNHIHSNIVIDKGRLMDPQGFSWKSGSKYSKAVKG